MSDHPQFPAAGNAGNGGSKAMAVSRNLLVSAIVFFFAVVVFVFLLHLYAKWRWGSSSAAARRRRRRARPYLVFGPNYDIAEAPRRGLELSVVESIPVRVYRQDEFKEGIECAVCLSEVADGEKLRLLPKCNHGFHVECIDMWFFSHSTCPLCRDTIKRDQRPEVGPSPAGAVGTESPDLPTSTTPEPVTPASSLAAVTTAGSLVIDIPRRVVLTAEDMKSPAVDTATPTRLESLRRFWSREKKVANCSSSCSSPCGDVEQGGISGGVQRSNAEF